MVGSVRAHTRGPWRMFVHDNDSEDGAAEWLAMQDDLHVVQNSRNLGFSRATNDGIKLSLQQSDSEWTVLMNNDVIVPDGWDQIMLSALAKHQEVKMCSPVLCKTRGRGYRMRHMQWHRAARRYGRDTMGDQDWLGLSCCFVHKDVWRRFGLLRCDGKFWHFGSDEEFGRRLPKRWRKCLYTGLSVLHWHSASRAYVHRRRVGERASRGIIWRLADEMYSQTKQVKAERIRELILDVRETAPTVEEIRRTLLLWLDRKRDERRRTRWRKGVRDS